MANNDRNFKMGTENEEIQSRSLPSYKHMRVSCFSKLNVRKGPDSTSEILKTINNNDPVMVDETYESKDWAKIHISSKTSGYVMKKYLK